MSDTFESAMPLTPDVLQRHSLAPGDEFTAEVWTDENPEEVHRLHARVGAKGNGAELVTPTIPPHLLGATVKGRVAMRTSSTDAAPSPTPTGNDIYSYIADQGYRFPGEVIARYLLSLRTKPFVILTGISGTGKTKIAQLVAEYYTRESSPALDQSDANEMAAPVVDLPSVPAETDDTFFARVSPSTLRYGTINSLSLLRYFDEPERGASEPIPVQLSSDLGGAPFSATLNNIGFADPSTQGIRLTLPTSIRRQLREHDVSVGDVLSLHVPNDGPATLSIAARVSVEEVTEPQAAEVSAATIGPAPRSAFISVRPDWTDNRGLLGYYNPLRMSYVVTPLLKLLLEANAEWTDAKAQDRTPLPYFVLLDEMNLAKVEYYFSDFLSVLESRKITDGKLTQEPLALHDHPTDLTTRSDDGIEMLIPRTLAIPPNVLFTGTVNVDETTYMFSPKVLDRANVIEFHDVDLPRYLRNEAAESDLAGLVIPAERTVHLSLGGHDHPSPTHAYTAAADLAPIVAVNELLTLQNRHFGYRVANEIGAFVAQVRKLVGTDKSTINAALDIQMLQKVLPKLGGSRGEVELILSDLLVLCLTGSAPSSSLPPDAVLAAIASGSRGLQFDPSKLAGSQVSVPSALDDDDADSPVSAAPASSSVLAVWPRSAEKLAQMLRRLRSTGFVSFVQ